MGAEGKGHLLWGSLLRGLPARGPEPPDVPPPSPQSVASMTATQVGVCRALTVPPEPLELPLAADPSVTVTIAPPVAHTGPGPIHMRLLSYQLREGQVRGWGGGGGGVTQFGGAWGKPLWGAWGGEPAGKGCLLGGHGVNPLGGGTVGCPCWGTHTHCGGLCCGRASWGSLPRGCGAGAVWGGRGHTGRQTGGSCWGGKVWGRGCLLGVPYSGAHPAFAPPPHQDSAALSALTRAEGPRAPLRWWRGPPLPPSPALLVHFHGGGFVAQTSRSHEPYLRGWARELGAPILSVDYALAPEAPFPRALEECFYAYCWALRNCRLLGQTLGGCWGGVGGRGEGWIGGAGCGESPPAAPEGGRKPPTPLPPPQPCRHRRRQPADACGVAVGVTPPLFRPSVFPPPPTPSQARRRSACAWRATARAATSA